MTISTTINRKEYVGDGSSTSFSFPYFVIAAADLKVYQNGTLKTITTHYTLSGSAPYGSGTNVQFVSAPALDDEIVIIRDPAITQAVDLVDNDPLPAASIETPLDRLTMICQRLKERIDRSFTLADTDVSGASTELPTPAANKLIGWDSAGMELANYASATITDSIIPSAFMETVLDDTSAATARTTLGALASAGDTMTGDLTMSGASIIEAEGAAVASASSTNIWATDGNTVHITGTTTINDFATAPQAGAWMKLIFDGALTLTQSANLNVNGGGANVTTAAGDVAFVYADTTTQMDVFVIRKSGAAVVFPDASVTAAKLDGAQSGSAPIFGARAWCVFDGTTAGTNAPTAGGNVSTVQRESTGVYLITFTTALADTNFATVVTAVETAGSGSRNNLCSSEAISTTTVRVRAISAATGSATDQKIVSVAVFR